MLDYLDSLSDVDLVIRAVLALCIARLIGQGAAAFWQACSMEAPTGPSISPSPEPDIDAWREGRGH